MLRTWLKIGFRSLLRNKLHSVINVMGLAIGISACICIYSLVTYEMSFDTFHPDSDRIHRVYTSFSGSFEGTNSGCQTGLPPEIKRTLPQVEEVAHFFTFTSKAYIPDSISENKDLGFQTDIIFADPSYFSVFSSYKWVAGNPESSLSSPFQVVLTEEKAREYFGLENAIEGVGREILYGDSLRVTVSGIVESLPSQTDFFFEDFISFSTYDLAILPYKIPQNNWQNTTNASQLFIKVREGTQMAELEAAFDELRNTNFTPDPTLDYFINFKTHKLEDLHFSTTLGLFSQSRMPSTLSTLYGLIALAVILMLIACINFVNLATAQALQRSKEVGVRKVLGGSRKSIMWQFLGETSVIVLLAICLSIGLTELVFASFGDFFPKELVFEPFRPVNLLFYAVILLSVSLLSGFYPAFVLAAFKPVKALKSKGVAYTDVSSQNWLQKALITVQFVVSISLIIATLLVGKQISFIMNKDLGVSAESLVFFNVPYWDTEENKAQVISEVKKLAGVKSVSIHTHPVVANSWSTSELSFHKVDEKQKEEVQHKWVDTSFIETYELELLAGRNLKEDAREYLVNEAMVKKLGFTDPGAVLGMTVMDSRGDEADIAYKIVGVINDYNYLPLWHQIDPMVLTSMGKKNTVGVKLEQGVLANNGFAALIGNIQEIYGQAFPKSEFDYEFMDEQIASYYDDETRMATLSQTATGVAIFISCIGLFGLISFSLVRRTKEIGIRKILGATVSNIFGLISADFLKLILVAFVIATPITWYFMNSWLQEYTYQTPISVWVFILSGFIACSLALITIGYQTFKAASANPVEALRME